MTALTLLLWSAVYLWAFWGLYVLVMGIYRAKLAGRLTSLHMVLGAPYVLIGYFVDVFANCTIAWIFFWERPRELLVTTRLKRYVEQTGWRRKVAVWICDRLLDIYDPTGNHC